MDAYKLVKENSTSVINSDRFLPCLELLMNILEQQRGPERLAKAEELRKEMEASQADWEVMYAAALEETRRDKREKWEEKRKQKKGNQKRRGRKVKKKRSEKRGGGKAPVDGGKRKEEETRLSLKDLILEEEEGEPKREKEEEEDICAICLGPMDEEEDEDDVIWRLQCSHAFHGGCLESWTSTRNRKGLPLTCPTCRQPLLLR